MPDPLNGAWRLQSGQPLAPGARDVKIIAGGRFMFAAYDARTGAPLYAAGGSCRLTGEAYVEHMEFASEPLAALVGQDQRFTVKVQGDTFTQDGALTNGRRLHEVWKRMP